MKFKKFVADLLIPLNVLLIFFLVFESFISTPAWLKVFGRMHPLALHFPIVLAVAYALLLLVSPARLRKEKWFTGFLDALLLSAALTAVITALMGLILSTDGYEADAIAWHKWSGVLLPPVLFVLYMVRDFLMSRIQAGRVLAVMVIVLITVAGHQGAIITHGENFVMEPITPEKIKVKPSFEEAVVYGDLVQPIIDEKCLSCHNEKKAKGELIMETRELLLKGGKHGKLWDTTKPDLGLLMTRLHLPEDDKKHMPPPGKPQLSDQEVVILESWIKAGADFEKRLAELSPSDTLYKLAKTMLKPSSEATYDFPAADEKTIKNLSNNNRTITPLAQGSPALAVNFYNQAFFSEDALKELEPINKQVVSLNLINMPVKDEHLKLLRSFKNLRKLNLNFTKITGKSLGELQQLPLLESLSLTGTPVEFSNLRTLVSYPRLNTVSIWSTSLTEKDIEELKKQNKKIAFVTGFNSDTVVLQLTPPLMMTEVRIVDPKLGVVMQHHIKGTEIRYTLDGSEPDSTHSALLKDSVIIDKSTTVRAKAFKKGWISSDILATHFYKRTFHPDTIIIAEEPEVRFAARGAESLYDSEKSDINYFDGKWLGFQDTKLDALIGFNKPVEVRNVTLSVLRNIDAYIFLPQRIEIWGGESRNSMKLLTTVTPKQPTKKEEEPNANVPVECNFTPTQVRFLRLKGTSVQKIPAWHQGRGEKAHLLIDELFIN